jgi:hypothetical protein
VEKGLAAKKKIQKKQQFVEEAIQDFRDIVFKKKKICKLEDICSCCELPLYICQTLYVWHFKVLFIKSLYCNDYVVKKRAVDLFFEAVFTFI